ncbi:MAG: FHA domain-containing protein [Thermoanaerobaculales bacterium]|nr:FHA domain-containing protein [Thermoanaerobaculales bacterium]
MRLFFLLLFPLAVFAGAGELPLVVAVDTSRSLRVTDMASIHEALSVGFESLPDGVPIGLIAFDDRARWLSLPTTNWARVLDAMVVVEPAGSYTVFYDALYLAAQELGDGGVVLAITDGRDENSAVRVEDIESLCARNGVRLLTAGVGRRVDERGLRRLALLTRGRYIGSFPEMTPRKLAAAVQDYYAEIRDLDRPAVPQEHPATDQEPTPAPFIPEGDGSGVVEEPSTGSGFGLWPLVVVPAVAVVFLAVFGLLWLFLRSRSRQCEVCGAGIPKGEASCPSCEIEAVRRAAAENMVADESSTRMPDLEDESLARETIPGGLDQTMVLAELGILAVREEGQAERIYTLPRGRVFAVGRAPRVNTIQVEDPTISAQHFKVVYKEDGYYVVDLGATNGTSVNNERIRIRRLLPGDIIRAGLTEFEFAFHGGQVEEGVAEAERAAPPPLRNE